MTQPRGEKGKFQKKSDQRAQAAKDMHNMTHIKTNADYGSELITVTDEAMTKLGTAKAQKVARRIERAINFQTDFAEIYSPSQNFIDENASGGDHYAEGGRVPLAEMVSMTEFRAGWAYRATYGKAEAIYRNGYEFVPEDFDIDTEAVEQKEIKKFFDEVDWFSWRIQHLFREKQTGLGIGIPIYPFDKNKEDLGKKININTITQRPRRLIAYSAYHLYPTNITQYELGDYDKSKWNFRGGVDSTVFNHSRITLLETKPEPFQLRGLAEIEPIWTPAICYFNTMIFVLKTLAQVGVMSVGIQSPNEIPTSKEAQAYLDMLNDFRANKFYLLGKGATLVTQNMAAKIGSGLNDYLEFLKEDISARLVIPKNQLFGRSEGGGLDGAGALVSKDDMLAGFMAEANGMTSEELAFLRGPCKFKKHLEGLTLRWKIDLHKTEMERLQEEAMRIDMEMKRQMAEQAKKQMKMNNMLIDAQMKEVKRDPKAFLDKMNTQVERESQGALENKPDQKGTNKELPNKQNKEAKQLENKSSRTPAEKKYDSQSECENYHMKQGKSEAQAKAYCKSIGKNDMFDFMQYYREVKFKFGGPLDRKFKPRKVDDDIE